MRQPHPFALIYPPYGPADRAVLRASLETDGQLRPVLLAPDESIADGWHRYQVLRFEMNRAEEDIRFEMWEGNIEGLWIRVDSLNRARRHMDSAQRACAAVKYLQTAKEFGGTVSRVKRAELAYMFRTSDGYIGQALAVRNNHQEMFEKICRGEISLPDGYEWSRGQRRPPTAVPRKAASTKVSSNDTDEASATPDTAAEDASPAPASEPTEPAPADVVTTVVVHVPPAPQPRVRRFACVDEDDDLGAVEFSLQIHHPRVRATFCPLCGADLNGPVSRDRHSEIPVP